MFEDRERPRTQNRTTADIVAELARRFMVLPDPPSRLPTVRELARDYRSSIASIHVAIGRLEDAGAIEVSTRGRLGAFLVDRSIGRLWAIAENGPLVISLPLASSPRYEALATAIKQILTKAGVEVFLIFVRGSRQRLQAVRDGRCHLAAMSSFAAGELCEADDEVVLEMGPHSYNTGHRVFVSAAANDPHPIRVIVDALSVDQQRLTALEFTGADTVSLPATTGQITRLLETGQADAAVWTIDEMLVRRPVGVLDRPLRPEVVALIGDADTRAVLVGRHAKAGMLRAVTAPIEIDEVARLEEDVVEGRVVPEY